MFAFKELELRRPRLSFVVWWCHMSDHISFFQKMSSGEAPAVNVRVQHPAVPTHVQDPLFRLPRRLCHTLLGFLCCCYNSLLCLGKSFHEHIHGWRISSHSSRGKKTSALSVRCFFSFLSWKGKEILSNWIGSQLLLKVVICIRILCSFHPRLY